MSAGPREQPKAAERTKCDVVVAVAVVAAIVNMFSATEVELDMARTVTVVRTAVVVSATVVDRPSQRVAVITLTKCSSAAMAIEHTATAMPIMETLTTDDISPVHETRPTTTAICPSPFVLDVVGVVHPPITTINGVVIGVEKLLVPHRV